MQVRYWSLVVGFLLFVSSCDLQTSQFDPFLYGKVQKTLFYSGEDRNYIIHVPSGYIGSKALPLVVVFHDRGDSAQNFYEKSGWKKICEKENVFAIFPQAKDYCYVANGETFMESGWNVAPVNHPSTCSASTIADDAGFLDKLIEKTFIEYNIDKKNLYLAGLGEGGQMVAKVLLESDIAWTAATQFAGSYTTTYTWNPLRQVPVLFQVGNLDDQFFQGQVPASMTQALQGIEDSRSPFFPIVASYTAAYQLAAGFQLAGDSTRIVKASYKALDGKDLLEISLVKNVKHEYPDQSNIFQAATEHWSWMKKVGGM